MYVRVECSHSPTWTEAKLHRQWLVNRERTAVERLSGSYRAVQHAVKIYQVDDGKSAVMRYAA